MLRSFIKAILLERASDIKASDFAAKLADDIIDAIKNFDLKPTRLDSEIYWFISLDDLGLIVPRRIQQLKIGIRTKYGVNSTASFLFPDKDLPAGAVVINNSSAPKKVTGDYVSRLFSTKKTSLFHELTHAWDFLIGPLSFEKSQKFSVDSILDLNDYPDESKRVSKYYSLEHEKNAYLRQAFQKFLSIAPTDSNKALELSHDYVWKRVSSFFPKSWSSQYTEEELLKKFAARVFELWDDYKINLSENDE